MRNGDAFVHINSSLVFLKNGFTNPFKKYILFYYLIGMAYNVYHMIADEKGIL